MACGFAGIPTVDGEAVHRRETSPSGEVTLRMLTYRGRSAPDVRSSFRTG
jgi:hypothetical protein